ncbi:hemerythrin domain-containing protein [Candidatus Berkiella aquae]|uniref:Hemerythrin domain-containing protein n=1 Tax=Candidatus Berkiella aquae TaxID=295108 RepID=A0A0Q9YJH5_9GAMM|nr:hemerythrin domain-containing protein [Candidatus Berkiella aquae]MCS5711289.1 hemerythrin domain-containing protein [Candidatus Berkiella aquae]
MNAIQILLTDHKKMKQLLLKLSKMSEKKAAERKKLFNTIKHEAKLHEKMEEQLFYPHLIELSKSRANVLEHHEEVVLVEHMITKLSRTDPKSEKWTAKFTVFKELNDHHIEEEEDEKFPQAIKLLSRNLLLEIGEQMQDFKKKHK